MIESCGVGDDVLTTGGIYGTITRVEGDDLVVEIAEGTTVHMTRRGVAAVLPPEEDEEEEEEGEGAADDDADEGSVTAQEDGVTAPAGDDAAAAERR
jgi:preprotein translocase subunit YajC